MTETNFGDGDSQGDFDGGEDFGDGGAGGGQQDGEMRSAYEMPESLDDQDREIVASLFDGVEGLTSETANALLSRYGELLETVDNEVETEQLAARDATITALRDEWGADYQANLDFVVNGIEALPIADEIASAYTADGFLLNSLGVVKWLFETMKEKDMQTQQRQRTQQKPTGEARRALESEMYKIKEMMGTQKYIRNPAKQERYKELLRLLGLAD